MWKILVVILLLVAAFLFVKRQQKRSKVKDHTGDMLELSHLKDVYANDILDTECQRIMNFT